MRWHDLFADLEAQASSLERAEQETEVADRTRAELGQVSLINRLRAVVEQPAALLVTGSGWISGEVSALGADWILLRTPEELIVRSAAVMAARELPPRSVSPHGVGVVAGRLTLASALRAVAIDRAAVTIVLTDGSELTGTPDRVGADWLDVALHDVGDAPRRSAVRSRMTVSYQHLASVRRRTSGWEA
ncbi:MAG: hypothetical protein ACR2KG_12565 [Nocardioidaceae bacterium]